MFVPLGREHAATLRIKVGAVGRATPFSKSATRVGICISVANEVRLAVCSLEGATLGKGNA